MVSQNAQLGIGIVVIILIVASVAILSSQVGALSAQVNALKSSFAGQLATLSAAVVNASAMNAEMSTQSMTYSNSSNTSGLPMCGPATVPINGSSEVTSYYVSANYTGKCYPGPVDSRLTATSSSEMHMAMGSVQNTFNASQGVACDVVKGVGTAGYCEPVQMGYIVNATSGASPPTEEWFHFAGVTLAPGQFLDMVDTTPFFTTKGHVAMVIPCYPNGSPKVVLVEGVVDGGLNTLQPITPQYLQQLSDPGNLCVYHFDIGVTGNNPEGVTDFAVINIANTTITFPNRSTSTFSLAEGYLNQNS